MMTTKKHTYRYLLATEIVLEFSKAGLGTCGSLPATEKTENMAFMKTEKEKARIKAEKTSWTQK